MAVFLRNTHAYTHFHNQGGGIAAVKAVCQGGFQNGACPVNPDEVYIQLLCQGKKGVFMNFVDAHLRNFCEENVAGMDVDTQVGVSEVIHDFRCQIFIHTAIAVTGEQAVHIHVEGRNPACDGVDAKWIHGGINVHDAVEMLLLFVDSTNQLEADKLTFQFITVNTRDNGNAFFIACEGIWSDSVFLYFEYFVNRQSY